MYICQLFFALTQRSISLPWLTTKTMSMNRLQISLLNDNLLRWSRIYCQWTDIPQSFWEDYPRQATRTSEVYYVAVVLENRNFWTSINVLHKYYYSHLLWLQICLGSLYIRTCFSICFSHLQRLKADFCIYQLFQNTLEYILANHSWQLWPFVSFEADYTNYVLRLICGRPG